MSLLSFIHSNSTIRLLFLVSALAALGSCKKVEVYQGGNNHEISFSPSLSCLETKADTEFRKSAKFFTYAWYLPDGKIWDNNKAEAKLYIDKAEVGYHSKENPPFVNYSWHADQVYYWPKGGSLTFFSYTCLSGAEFYSPAITPGNSSECVFDKDEGLSIKPFPTEMNCGQDFDLLVAKVNQACDMKYDSKRVPTRFEHKLTKISFFVTLNVQTTDKYKLTGLKLTDIFMQGEYYGGGYDNDYWEKPQSLASDYSMFKSAPEDIPSVNPIEIRSDKFVQVSDNNVIPQTLLPYTASQWSARENTVKLKISYTKNDKPQSDIIIDFGKKEEKWRMGTHYKYTIKFGGTTKSDSDGSAPVVQLTTDVSPWL